MGMCSPAFPHHLVACFGVLRVKIIPIGAELITLCMFSGVVYLSHGHDEAAWHWTSSFALFLNGYTHQL